MDAAKGMAELKRYDVAVALCRQAAIMEPGAPTPYANALVYAEEGKNADGMAWAAGNLLRQEWPLNNDDLHGRAKSKLDDLTRELTKSNHLTDAQKLQAGAGAGRSPRPGHHPDLARRGRPRPEGQGSRDRHDLLVRRSADGGRRHAGRRRPAGRRNRSRAGRKPTWRPRPSPASSRSTSSAPGAGRWAPRPSWKSFVIKGTPNEIRERHSLELRPGGDADQGDAEGRPTHQRGRPGLAGVAGPAKRPTTSRLRRSTCSPSCGA